MVRRILLAVLLVCCLGGSPVAAQPVLADVDGVTDTLTLDDADDLAELSDADGGDRDESEPDEADEREQ